MYDMHYDLLTILYFNHKEKSDKANLEELRENCKRIYKNGNIQGGIANLYFMSKKEMLDQLNISGEEIDNLVQMFRKSLKLLETFKEQKIIPNDIDFTYGIEGCDFLNICDLEKLYGLGLRVITPVWNNENKYGSGNRSDKGLTSEGEKLIKRAIDLKIGIDVSHANQKTFDDILNLIKQNEEKKPIVIASHSNVRSLCDVERNLNDAQLKKLRDVDGYISLVTYGKFVSMDNESMTYNQREESFLKHLDYLIDEIKFSEDRIMISTDDMNFEPNVIFHNREIFKIEEINLRVRELLKNKYSQLMIENILVNNPKRVIKELNKK